MMLQPAPVTRENTAACVAELRAGHPVIIPTDTVYGIAAPALDEGAVDALYAAKGRERSIPLQLLFAPGLTAIRRFARLDPRAADLVEALGPGGWTVIVPAAPGWSSVALAGGSTVGVRIPASSVVHAIVRSLGQPLAASSANRHGEPSPRSCAEAIAQVGPSCAFALDAGPAPAGIDSTVIDCSREEVRILREGAIDRETVARILGIAAIPVLRSVRR